MMASDYKWKNHFSEMKEDVGMSPYEKEREQEDAYPMTESHPTPSVGQERINRLGTGHTYVVKGDILLKNQHNSSFQLGVRDSGFTEKDDDDTKL